MPSTEPVQPAGEAQRGIPHIGNVGKCYDLRKGTQAQTTDIELNQKFIIVRTRTEVMGKLSFV